MANKIISTSSRNENTRDKNPHEVPLTDLEKIKEQFDKNINSIKERFSIAEELNRNGHEEQEKDIYRTQIVFLESALDYYIHCLSIHASIQMSKNAWPKTGGYKNLTVPIEKVFYAIENPEDSTWIKELIVGHHVTKTYMSSKEIKGQISLIIACKGIFKKIADEMYHVQGSNEKTQDKLINLLDGLFDRRNKIAHQSDRNHDTGLKYDIVRTDVENYLDEIPKFVEIFHKKVNDFNISE